MCIRDSATIVYVAPDSAVLSEDTTLVSEPAKAAIAARTQEKLVCVDGPENWNADVVCMTHAEWESAVALAEQRALADQRDRAIMLALNNSSRRP